MELADLVTAVHGRWPTVDPVLRGDPGVDVRFAEHDSRAELRGGLFCCVPGATVDGHRFAEGAVAAGATALLVERELPLPVPQLQVSSVRAAMGPCAAVLAGTPSDRLEVVGITGTNGKTTTAHLVASILRAAGRSCGVIGTLSGARTTPEAPELQRTLAKMADDGCDAVAMEVSSHALDLHRVDGTHVRVAVFTNLSQDHLDHHGTMEAYFAAKARLFTPELCDLAILNVEDPYGQMLADTVAVPVVPYGLYEAEGLELAPERSSFSLGGQRIEVPLPGRFNVANALAAAHAALALGIDAPTIARGLADAGVVAGRFERVDAGQPFLAAVDYAHTPDGLRQLLLAARELTSGRVVLVFGAGGDRDHGKRPLMGATAAELADAVVLTSDNPRSEDPAAIISAVHDGMTNPTDLHVEPDRARAIALGVALARPGDVLLVAGKGHETTQTAGSTVTPFDDREVLRSALAAVS